MEQFEQFQSWSSPRRLAGDLVKSQQCFTRKWERCSAGVEPDNAVKERGLVAGILEEIDRDVGKLHVGVAAPAPIEELRFKLATFLLMVSRKEIIRLTGMQQRPRKGCQSISIPAKVAMRRKIRSDSRDSD